MKSRAQILSLLILISSLTSATQLRSDSHDIMIQKLEVSLKSDIPDAGSVRLRLADLLADKARLLILEQASESQINEVKGSAFDQYDRVFSQIDTDQKVRAIEQMGHLAMGPSREKRLNKHLNDLKKSKSKRLRARAILVESHAQFSKANYKSALSGFEFASKLDRDLQTESLRFKMGWCLFHLGKTASAEAKLQEILLARRSQDEIFYKDVAMDLVLFASRHPVTSKKINQIHQLAPQSHKKEVLMAFSQFLDRYGKSLEAIRVLEFVESHFDIDNRERADLQAQKMKVARLGGQKALALKHFESALGFFKASDCSSRRMRDDENCLHLQKTLRGGLLAWASDEKLDPSKSLLKGYDLYGQVFTDDYEVAFWSAQVAMIHKKHAEARAHFRRASGLTFDSKDDPAKSKVFDASLLGEIEASEALGKAGLKRESYEYLLEKKPGFSDADKVRYNIAQTYFDEKNFEKSGQLMESLLLSTKDKKVQTDGVALAMESAIQLKQPDLVIARARKLKSAVPKRAQELAKLERRALIEKSAVILKAQDQSESTYQRHLDELKTVDLKLAPHSEKMTLLQNRIALAERARDINEVLAASLILKVSANSKSDLVFAEKKRVESLELKLDFKSAYNEFKRSQWSKSMNKIDSLQKSIVLARLAGLSANQDINRYLKLEQDLLKRNTMRLELIRASAKPWTALKGNKKELLKTPELFAQGLLEVYSKAPNQKLLKKNLGFLSRKVKPIQADLLERSLNWSSFQRAAKLVANHKLNVSSPKQATASVVERIKRLEALEKLSNQSQKQGDWFLQVYTLSVLQAEYQRFSEDILRAPAPKNLSEAQMKIYQAAIQKESGSYRNLAQKVASRLREIGKNQRPLQDLLLLSQRSSFGVRSLVASVTSPTVDAKPFLSGENRSRLEQLIDVERPASSQKLASLKQKLSESPYDLLKLESTVQDIIEAETLNGNFLAADYFAARRISASKTMQIGGIK